MNRRMMMSAVKGEESLLPSEYQQVEWIQTNNACRIDSGVAFDGTRDFCLEAIALIPVQDFTTPFMGWNAGGIFGASPYGTWYDGSTTTGLILSTTKKTKVEQVIYAGANSNTVTKYTYVENSATQTFTRTHPNVSNRLALTNYPLFAVSKAPPDWDYSTGRMRLYEIKLGFNGVFETHLIPCYRKADNSIGMYDIIKKSFRPNLGTGTFTKGADVN